MDRHSTTHPSMRVRAVGITALLGLFLFFTSERIPFNSGYGMDGLKFGAWASAPLEAIRQGIDAYNIARMLPSVCVWGIMQVAQTVTSTGSVITYFSLLNLTLWILSGWLIWEIGVRLGLSPRARSLAMVLCLVNYGLANHAFYYPVLTDVSSFFLATLSFYLYTRQRWALLYLVAFLGAFTWPTLLPCTLALTLFTPPTPVDNQKDAPNRWMGIVAGLATVFVICAPIFLLVKSGQSVEYMQKARTGIPEEFVRFSPFGLLVVIVVAALPIASLFSQTSLKDFLYRINFKRLGISIALFVLCQFCIQRLSNGQPGPGALLTWRVYILTSTGRAFLPLVAHFTYFGAIPCLFPYFWREFVGSVIKAGPAIVLVVAMSFLIGIDSESRQLTAFLPFLAVFLAQAMDQRGFSHPIFVTVVMIGVGTSKIWLRINDDIWSAYGARFEEWTDPVAQLYMMNHGPWMTFAFLYRQGMFLVITLVLLSAVLWLPRLPAATNFFHKPAKRRI